MKKLIMDSGLVGIRSILCEKKITECMGAESPEGYRKKGQSGTKSQDVIRSDQWKEIFG
jgi:hypothetical protein